MKQINVLYHIARADFLERVRRYSFLLTLGFAGLLAPAVYRGELVLTLGNYYGAPSSAWFGAFLAVVATTFLSMVGFYIVKNAIQRDEQTRVGRILAATPLSKFAYCTGKVLSNFAVLSVMVVVLATGAAILQLIRGQGGIDWWQLLSPFLFIALPAMATLAAIALLFETIPGLRGGLGNALYIFFFMGLLATSFQMKQTDFTGIRLCMQSMGEAVRQLDPGYHESFSLQIGPHNPATKQFAWSGLHWTAAMIGQRLLWVGIAMVIGFLASLLFHRFDPAKESKWSRRRQKPHDITAPAPIQPLASAAASTRLTPLREALASGPAVAAASTPSLALGSFMALVRAELRLMLNGVSRWWYLVAVGLWIASLSAPLEISRGILLAIWIWPLLLWSKMGARESTQQTSALIFCCAYPLRRQLPAAWIAGVLVAFVSGSGVFIRLLLSGDTAGLAAWLGGALFVPSLALALGVWSGTSKTFEAVYTMWWYIGPSHHMPYVDFMGTTTASGRPLLYIALAGALLGIAFAGRRSQLAYA